MIVIVDYNAGNLGSVQRACSSLGIESAITKDPETVAGAERIIFPGIGAAPASMETLRAWSLDEALKSAFARGAPILGICIGAQIILDRSEEGNVDCLGLVPGETVRFRLDDPGLKIPHIGWNGIRATRPHPLLDGIEEGDEFYFVHAYHPRPADAENVFAVTEYGTAFCSALGRDNLFATQFHPEKSGRLGLGILDRFSRWNGEIGRGGRA